MCDKIKDFEMGTLSRIIRWAQCDGKGPNRGKRKADRSFRVREGCEDAMLLALKMEEGVMSQGMQVASSSWRWQGNGFSH